MRLRSGYYPIVRTGNHIDGSNEAIEKDELSMIPFTGVPSYILLVALTAEGALI